MKNTFSCSSCKLVIAALILSFLVADAASRSPSSLAKWTKANKSSEFVSKYGSQSKSVFKDASSIKELLFLERPSRDTITSEGNSSIDSSSFYTQKPEVVDLEFEKKYGNTIEIHLAEEESQNTTETEDKEVVDDEEDLLLNEDDSLIVNVNLKPTIGSPTTQPFEMPERIEENIIPVFSEWTQKQMEEAEKKLEKEGTNSSAMKKNATDQGPSLKVKVRAKNYASPDCGAKIIIANPEAESSSSVLSASKDEYLLSPCTSKIWFVVELCEAIRAEKIELANFELYSSSPKDFSISVSNRFPTREWLNVGQFTAKDERNVQKYNLHPLVFGKFIRVEVNSHYSKEHFCPISLFRVYGTSEFEAFETENHPEIIEGDLLDDDSDVDTTDSKRGNAKNNIFKSASDAVLSIVKKAAEVLGKGDSSMDNNTTTETQLLNSPTEKCFTFAYLVNCVNCSRDLQTKVIHLLNCKHSFLLDMLKLPRIREIVHESGECGRLIDIDLMGSAKEANRRRISYFSHLLPPRYLIALCNLAAAVDNHMALNPNLNIWNDSVISEIPETEKSLMGLEKFDKNVEKIRMTPLEEENIYSQNTSRKEVKPQIDDKPSKDGQKKTSSEGKKIQQENPKDHGKKAKKESPQSSEGSKGHSTVPESPPANGNGNSNAQTQEDPLKDSHSGGNLVESEPVEEDLSQQAHQNTTEHRVDENEQVDHKSPQVPAQQENTKETPNGAPHEAATNNEANNLPVLQSSAHSESVFLRLSNRIKALERNMSLSGQYLEELSKRYKKQVEELQSSFAKALLSIEEQSRRFDEKKEFMLLQHESLREQCEDIMDKICKFCFVFGVSFTCLQILIIYLYSRAYHRISRRCKLLMDCVKRSQTANATTEECQQAKEISSDRVSLNSSRSSEGGEKVMRNCVTDIKEEDESIQDVSVDTEEVSGSNASGLSGRQSEEDVPVEDLNSSELELSTESRRVVKSLSNHVESPSRGSEKSRSSFPLRESIARRLSSPVLFKTSRKSQHSNSAAKSKDTRQNSTANHKVKPPKANSMSTEVLTKATPDSPESPGVARQVDEPLIKKTGSFRRILKKVF